MVQERSPEADSATPSEPLPERMYPVGGAGISRYREHERRRKP